MNSFFFITYTRKEQSILLLFYLQVFYLFLYILFIYLFFAVLFIRNHFVFSVIPAGSLQLSGQGSDGLQTIAMTNATAAGGAIVQYAQGSDPQFIVPGESLSPSLPCMCVCVYIYIYIYYNIEIDDVCVCMCSMYMYTIYSYNFV